MSERIAVIGAGSMGTAVSVLLASNGHDITMWSLFQEEVDMINEYREQKDKLPGVKVPRNVVCTADLEKAVRSNDIIVLVIPTQTLRNNLKVMSELIRKDTIVACFSKGLEESTGFRPSEVIQQEVPHALPVAMSGPCHAEELGKGIPSAYVAAAKEKATAEFVQDIFMNPYFRVYTNPDMVGVELGGALKNIIALCAGISDGLGFGDNTKAALMTRGITEMTRLGVAMGAQPRTFSGLTGIGDLIVTCTSMHSRNRRAGILIGKGKTADEASAEVKMVVEGITTTKAAYELSKRMDVSMPITEEAYNVLFEGKNAKQAVVDLMTRERKHEMEEITANDEWQR